MKYKHAEWCYTCGAKLHVIDYVYAYDEFTGAEKIGYMYECPGDTRPWWKKLFVGHPKTEGESYALDGCPY